MSYQQIVREQLKIDEGIRAKPYKDTVGKWTAGVGRNLDDVGLRPDEIDLMLDNDIAQAEKDARLLVKNFDSLSDARKAVVINLAFNLGFRRLSTFVETLRHIQAEEFDKAADCLMDSLWAKQVGPRAVRLTKAMREG